jgi:3-deoxy-7-phosphoheptulonate synthase
MLIEWREDASDAQRQRVKSTLAAVGARFVEVDDEGAHAPSRLVIQQGAQDWMETLIQDRAVQRLTRLSTPYKLAARAVRPGGTVVDVAGVRIGGRELVVIAGPCSVEDATQMGLAARSVAASGASILRAGAYKPRTSPYAFQGLAERGLTLLREAGQAAGLPTVTEVIRTEDVALVAANADMLQIGARNAQNFALLEAAGRSGKPVLLKRGPSMTVEELLLAAEYVLATGNQRVVLCERGIRTFERATRNTLDLSAVAVLKRATHLPVLVDPSHGTGKRALIEPLARAAAAAGADGLLVEVHPTPDASWSDAEQAMSLDAFAALCRGLAVDAAVVGRTLRAPCAPSAEETLRACRDRIDAIDEVLVRLIDARMRLAEPIGAAKRRQGAPIGAPEREAAVRARVAGEAARLGSGQALLRVFDVIVDETRALQQPLDDVAELPEARAKRRVG